MLYGKDRTKPINHKKTIDPNLTCPVCGKGAHITHIFSDGVRVRCNAHHHPNPRKRCKHLYNIPVAFDNDGNIIIGGEEWHWCTVKDAFLPLIVAWVLSPNMERHYGDVKDITRRIRGIKSENGALSFLSSQTFAFNFLLEKRSLHGISPDDFLDIPIYDRHSRDYSALNVIKHLMDG